MDDLMRRGYACRMESVYAGEGEDGISWVQKRFGLGRTDVKALSGGPLLSDGSWTGCMELRSRFGDVWEEGSFKFLTASGMSRRVGAVDWVVYGEEVTYGITGREAIGWGRGEGVGVTGWMLL
jgi:hypothetical protein